MGGECSTNGGEERRSQGFGGETQERERDHLEDRGIDGRIIRWIFRKWDGGHGLDQSGSG